MPRYRTPTAVARVTGADKLHPGRHAGRASPVSGPLGPPDDELNTEARKAWAEFANDMPWLGRSDRMLVNLAARLTCRIREPDCPLGVFTQLRLCVAAMGGTPVDRSRVNVPDADEDPADEFLQ